MFAKKNKKKFCQIYKTTNEIKNINLQVHFYQHHQNQEQQSYILSLFIYIF